MRRPGTIGRASAAAALVWASASCVTERVPATGVPVPPRPVHRDVPTRSGTTPLPSGPVATPATARATVSRVRVEVAPVGTVAYDGQVLPLVSPDGAFLASQVGLAPAWETQLAGPGASVPLATRIAVWSVPSPEEVRAGGTVAQIEPPGGPLNGLVLARGADESGFLVEAPQADGSRWIAQVSWVGQRLSWLVRDGTVNAHATLTSQGDLVFVRRSVSEDSADLVLRSGSEESVVRAAALAGGGEASFSFPMTTGDPSVVYALLHTPEGIDLVALQAGRAGGDLTAPVVLGGVIARQRLTSSTGMGVAYQTAAPVAPALPRAVAGDPLAVLHPVFARMARFDLRTGAFALLPEGSVSAARVARDAEPGWFVTTPQGLVYVEDGREGAAVRADARVLSDPVVARATIDPVRQFVLLGPASDPLRLTVSLMRVAVSDSGD